MNTDRLHIRELVLEDAPFIFELLNQETWKQFIGDRNIQSLQHAEQYIITGPQKMYEEYGFGLMLVIQANGNRPIGLCGLLRREHLDAPDLGFAILQEYEGNGYMYEASEAILADAQERLEHDKIWAYTSDNNIRSQSLLIRLGFHKTQLEYSERPRDEVYFVRSASNHIN